MNKQSLILFFAITIILFSSCSKDQGPEKINVTVSSKDAILYNGVETEFSIVIDGTIKIATYYLDGKSIGSLVSSPYTLKFTPMDIDPGPHEIKCIIESELQNEFTATKSLVVKLRLGDDFKGGKIFYLDEAGAHGLIASTKDLGANPDMGFFWGQSGQLGTIKESGLENTSMMSTVSPTDTYAGYYFKNGYTYNGFNDWYIPAINELKILKENKNLVGGFTNDSNWKANYWSSSELSSSNAEALHFNVLMGNSYVKNSYMLKVRPIRKF